MGKDWCKIRYLIIALILMVGLTPIGFYWFTAGQYAITPDKAKSTLNSANSNAVLVDIRSPEEFEKYQ